MSRRKRYDQIDCHEKNKNVKAKRNIVSLWKLKLQQSCSYKYN